MDRDVAESNNIEELDELQPVEIVEVDTESESDEQ
jgi:hypothetical protein